MLCFVDRDVVVDLFLVLFIHIMGPKSGNQCAMWLIIHDAVCANRLEDWTIMHLLQS